MRIDPDVRRLFVFIDESKTALREVARRSGVSYATICGWRNGRAPQLALFRYVCDALGIHYGFRD